MKTIFTILFTVSCIAVVNAQTAPDPKVTIISPDPKVEIQPVEVSISEDPIAPEEPCNDCDTCPPKQTKLSFGNIKIIIYEEAAKSEIRIEENGDTTIIIKHPSHRYEGFTGVWQGFSLFSNGMLTYDNKMNLPENMRFIETDYAKSMSAALNFAPLQLGITKRLGIESGFGIQWNRYGIKNNYGITFNEDSLYGISTPDYVYSKNVIKSTYITVPLLLTVNTNKSFYRSFHFAVGVIGGYKLGSRLKQEYEFEGRNYEFKTKGHYHFNPFQASLTARVGYGNVLLFANYGLTRIFDQGRGPQLYPIQIGLHFIFA